MFNKVVGLICLLLLSCVSHMVATQLEHENSKLHVRNLRDSRQPRGENLQLGAIYMLVPNWRSIREGRNCYFNLSMNALASKWRPHNKYPIILMDTKPWSRQDMVDIRRTWTSLDFKFINVARTFDGQPLIPESQFLDAAAPLQSLGYKRMCNFFIKGFTQVPLLMNYKYLMRLDDDTCILDHINFDVFKYLSEKRAAYAYTHNWYDEHKVVEELYTFTDEYVADQRLQWQNPALHNQTVTAKHFPDLVPAFNTNFEVINTVRYREKPMVQYVDAVVESQNIFHRRWGDAPLRYLQAILFWTESDLVRLEGFELVHSAWGTMAMTEHPESGNPHLYLD